MAYRETGIKLLKQLDLSDSDSKTIDKKVYHISFLQQSNMELHEIYFQKLYQIVGDIILKVPTKDIIKNIEISKVDWDHPDFKENADRIAEQNDFIQNPFEVEEGVFQCKAINPTTGKVCGSRRVFSYTKQDRSSDEGTSVYAQCVACKTKWRERG